MDTDNDQARKNGDGRGTLFTLYVCFFLSGVAGLIYEVLWSRYLALFIGSTGLTLAGDQRVTLRSPANRKARATCTR